MNLLEKVNRTILALDEGCFGEARGFLVEIRDSHETERIDSAVSALSFTEQQAIRGVIGALGGDNGMVISANVADALDISRGCVVTALRKLESAGIVETRSLGQKGTHIKAKVQNWRDKLSKAIPA